MIECSFSYRHENNADTQVYGLSRVYLTGNDNKFRNIEANALCEYSKSACLTAVGEKIYVNPQRSTPFLMTLR